MSFLTKLLDPDQKPSLTSVLSAIAGITGILLAVFASIFSLAQAVHYAMPLVYAGLGTKAAQFTANAFSKKGVGENG